MRSLATIAIALSLGLAATIATADTMRPGNGNISLADAAFDKLKAAAGGGQKLQCSGAPGSATCTSKYAWVCPEGWKACRLSGDNKTCCTQK
jgi:hypothetical protein